METLLEAPIKLTPNAIVEIQRLMSRDEFDKTNVLRVGVKGGGCSGMSYVLGFDAKTDKDDLFSLDGIPCIINKTQGIYLAGMEIDWQDGLNARGFVFNNPNASKTCGCGTSFAV